MIKLGYRCIFSIFIFLCLSACATSPKTNSELQAGKRYFAEGYYKQALRYLLPAAAEHNADAEYALGYMYYYGYGVTQDATVGYFWIDRAAKQHYLPAVHAMGMMNAPG